MNNQHLIAPGMEAARSELSIFESTNTKTESVGQGPEPLPEVEK